MRSITAIGLFVFSSFALADPVSDSFSALLGSARAAADQGELCIKELKRTQDTKQCRIFSKAHDLYRERLKGMKLSLENSKEGPEAAASKISDEDWQALKREGKKIGLVIDYVESYAESHK